MSVIKVVSKDSCPFCVKAKELFEEAGKEYREEDVTKDVDFCNYMLENNLTVPRVYIDGVFIGGYVELCDYAIENEWV